MSSKRFGKKVKKPKDKAEKAEHEQQANPALKTEHAAKAANFARAHFQRRTSG